MKPQEIEDKSFRIIEKEAGQHGFNEREWPVVRRMIHTSADFDYIKTVHFYKGSVDPIEMGIQAILQGKNIITEKVPELAFLPKKVSKISKVKNIIPLLIQAQYVGAPRGRKIPADESSAREIVGTSR